MSVFEHYIRSGQRLLRCGFTTGTCAALATQGAVALLLGGDAPSALELVTPKGLPVQVEPEFCRMEGETAVCAVRKDAGDDSDVTDGLLVVSRVRRRADGQIVLDGGEGVGRVTLPGLDQPVGAAAINRVPRRMILEEAEKACRKAGYAGGLAILICIPGGEEVAQKTFNPRLGVEGGLSILGTSGIVEPMSEQALIDTIDLELRQTAARSRRVLLAPGNLGEDYIRAQGWDRLAPVVKCSNFIGDALDSAASCGLSEVLLVGHAGKLVKLAAGVMNTHSRYADGRAEVLCAYAALKGADRELCRHIMESVTVDAALDALAEKGLKTEVCLSVTEAAQRALERRAGGAFAVGVVLFSNRHGLLGVSGEAKRILNEWTEREGEEKV